MRKTLLVFGSIMVSCGVYAGSISAESQASPEPEKAQVVLIGTIHSAHCKNPKYSPEALKGIILSLKPDAILNELPLSLADSDGRPLEGIRSRTSSCPEVWAADTVATQLAIKQIPFDRPDRQENFKRTNFFERQKRCNEMLEEWGQYLSKRDPNCLALEIGRLWGYASAGEVELCTSGSPCIINSDVHDSIIRIRHGMWYEIAPRVLEAFPDYKTLGDECHFFRDQWHARNRIMADNIVKAAKLCPGKRLVVVTGATHRYILRDLLKDEEGIDLKEYWEIIKPDLQRSQESQDVTKDLPSEGTVSGLTMQQRICGLVKVWAAVEYKYALMEYAEVDWDGILPEYLALVKQSRSDDEYYLVLEKMIALLKDNHTYLMNIPGRETLYKPNLYLEVVEGQYVVMGFYGHNHSHPNVKAGDVVVAVDGKGASQIVEEVKPYICASSETEATNRALDRILWRGQDQSVRLTIRRSEEMFDVVLPAVIRRQRSFSPAGYDFSWRLLENGHACIRIPNFRESQIVEDFAGAIENVRDTNGLILDLRDNTGGNDTYGSPIAGRLLRKRIHFYRPVMESLPLSMVQKLLDAKIQDVNELTLGMSAGPSGPWQYDRPIVILVNWRTGSAAEDFTMGLQDCGRACIIGQRTAGSTGMPYYEELAGGAKARICRNAIVRLDGSRFHGVGIKPDVPVKRTIKAIMEGRDEVLEAAVSYLCSARDAGQETRVEFGRRKR